MFNCFKNILLFLRLKNTVMSRVRQSKALKLGHLKCDQFKDNQSVVSNSRSTSTYQFNKVRFSKTKIDDGDGSHKNLGFSSIVKAKERSRQNSINNSKRLSRENSLASLLDRDPSKLKLKSPAGRRFETKAGKLMKEIRKVHSSLKEMAQAMLVSFEKIKQQLEINFLKVSQQLLKMGKDSLQIQKIKTILQKGFASVRRSIIVLPQSLTHINHESEPNIEENRKMSQILESKKETERVPMTPSLVLVKNQHRQRAKPSTSSIFNVRQTQETIGKDFKKLRFKEQIVQKVRPMTQRKKQSSVTSFDNKSPNPTPQRFKTQRVLVGVSNESTRSIQDIINQMRQILNQQSN